MLVLAIYNKLLMLVLNLSFWLCDGRPCRDGRLRRLNLRVVDFVFPLISYTDDELFYRGIRFMILDGE